MKRSIIDNATYSTVRIEAELVNGKNSVGTAFFFRFCEKGEQFIPALVTNFHVIEGAKNGRIVLCKIDENNEPIDNKHETIELDNFESLWIRHPNPMIDLAIMPTAPLFTAMNQLRRKCFFMSIDQSLLMKENEIEELNSLEEIVMIGYPIGLSDKVNNKPIIRRGSTATHVLFDYNGNPEFLVDAACFPGSSGSPVFLYNSGAYHQKERGVVVGSRIKLLGILYSGPQFSVNGKLEVINIPTSTQIIASTRIPTNLGFVIKAAKLLEFETILENIKKA